MLQWLINLDPVFSVKYLPKMAELRAEQISSRRDGHNCQPRGLAHGFE